MRGLARGHQPDGSARPDGSAVCTRCGLGARRPWAGPGLCLSAGLAGPRFSVLATRWPPGSRARTQDGWLLVSERRLTLLWGAVRAHGGHAAGGPAQAASPSVKWGTGAGGSGPPMHLAGGLAPWVLPLQFEELIVVSD